MKNDTLHGTASILTFYHLDGTSQVASLKEALIFNQVRIVVQWETM
jgi:hypothetical protein